jgi:hypothetical protein
MDLKDMASPTRSLARRLAREKQSLGCSSTNASPEKKGTFARLLRPSLLRSPPDCLPPKRGTQPAHLDPATLRAPPRLRSGRQGQPPQQYSAATAAVTPLQMPPLSIFRLCLGPRTKRIISTRSVGEHRCAVGHTPQRTTEGGLTCPSWGPSSRRHATSARPWPA